MTEIISADWKLNETCNRLYGMLYVSFYPPRDKMSFSKGFTLPNPTNLRCAAYALLLAAETAHNADFFEEDVREIYITTKHKWLGELLFYRDVFMAYVENKEYLKDNANLRGVFNSLYTLVKFDDRLNFIYISRDPDDPAYIDLDKYLAEDGLDTTAMAKDASSTEKLEELVRDTRMRGVMTKKLVASGARCYRPMKKKGK